MKVYTDIEQSKKLTEILPPENADMWWNTEKHYPEFVKTYREHLGEQISPIPVWSLAALLNILPHCIDDGYDLTLGKLPDNESWYVCYDDVDHFVYIYITKSNLVDACVEMIIRLKEYDLL